MSRELYVGLISGTSMDGLDCALVAIEDSKLELLDYHSPPIDANFKNRLLSVCTNELVRIPTAWELDHELGNLFAQTVKALLERNNLSPEDITAIGSHGQTIWHQPRRKQEENSPAFTMQIGDPNQICYHTGITTVADFRRRDMAAGGQGAPLVPAFHSYLFGSFTTNCIVLNLGGMSNITRLVAANAKPVIAYDTGPGNVLLDSWIHKHKGKLLDSEGSWARSGKVQTELLKIFMSEPYLKLEPPKSTGRELFNLQWLELQLDKSSSTYLPEDVQATLLEFTIQSVREAILNEFEEAEIIVCGGGARNPFMMERLESEMKAFNLTTSEAKGMNPEAMEAAAFAWMARQTLYQHPIDLCSITGAREPVILGGVYYHQKPTT